MYDSGADRDLFANAAALTRYSEDTGKNIIVKSLSDWPTLPRVKVAHCPILKIDTDDYRASYRGKFRNQIKPHLRQSESVGIEIYVSDSEKDLLSFYRRLLAPTYRNKHQMLFQPYSLLLGLYNSGHTRLYLAKYQGEIVGGIFCAMSREVMHYNWGAMNSVGKLSIGGMLLDFALQDAQRLGIAWFDFGSTPLSHEPLLQFKTRFGATVWPVYNYYSLTKPSVSDYHSGWKIPRRIISKTPLALLIPLMPMVVPLLVS